MSAIAVTVPTPGMEVRMASRLARRGSAPIWRLDFGLEVFDRRFSRAELALDLDRRRPSRRRAELVEESGPGGDRGVAAARELLEGLHEVARRRGGVGLEAFAKDRQHSAVDPVGLGQSAQGLGEQPRPQRIDDGDGEAVGMEAAVGGAVKLARRLHRYERDLVGLQGTLQSFDTLRTVGELELPANRMDVDVEFIFTDVDSDVDWRRRASFGRNLALHAGLAPHHLFRTGAKGGRIKLPHGSKTQEDRDPARPILGGGHPQGSTRISIRFGLNLHARRRRGAILA